MLSNVYQSSTDMQIFVLLRAIICRHNLLYCNDQNMQVSYFEKEVSFYSLYGWFNQYIKFGIAFCKIVPLFRYICLNSKDCFDAFINIRQVKTYTPPIELICIQLMMFFFAELELHFILQMALARVAFCFVFCWSKQIFHVHFYQQFVVKKKI